MDRIITRDRFMRYRKVQMSGKRNMFGYDMLIQTHYDEAYKHFIDEKKKEDLIVQDDKW
jgi:hypothetical protein